MTSLAAKLAYLVSRSPGVDGEAQSNRALSAAIQRLPGHTRGGSVTAIGKLRRGDDDNPTIMTVSQLAAVLGAPSAFLLPGWEDVKGLTAFEAHSVIRSIARHLDGLPEDDLYAVLRFVQELRSNRGLTRIVPLEDVPELEPNSSGTVDSDRRSRAGGRRTIEDAADYAADSLEKW